MNRQLVICLDGTGNQFSHSPTNILRLQRALSADPAQVLSYYDPGLGTFGLKETLFEWQQVPARLFGLAFGWGLKRSVEGAYRFLAENFRAGDDIFLFGFSRGAFASRALAALIHAVGLLPAHQLHLFDCAWSMLVSREGANGKPDFKLQARFKLTFSHPIKVHFLGLFDTVKSVGWMYDPVAIPYTTNNPIVDVVRHAVAIDERRCFFRQHLWRPTRSSKTNVKEVWFAGVHSDVGGGYPPEESRLAWVAYRWMVGEALANGLQLNLGQSGKRKALLANETYDSAPMHDSMETIWKLAEWLPRMVWSGVDDKRRWRVGAMPPFNEPFSRKIPMHAFLHRSVIRRLSQDPTYKPGNLPDRYEIVEDDQTLQRLSEWST